MRIAYSTLVLLLGMSICQGQDEHTIRLKRHLEPGNSRTTTNLTKDKGTTRILDAEGNLLKQVKHGGSETIEQNIILSANKAGEPTKFIRKYTKATNTADDKTRPYSYEGRTLLFEKKPDGKFRIGVVGKEPLTNEDAEKLFDSVNKPPKSDEIMKQLAPKQAVKVGDSWKLDPKPIAKVMDVTINESQSTLTAKLVKVESTEKVKMGTFEISLKMAVKTFTHPLAVKFDPPALYSISGTIQTPIDASSSYVKASLKAGLKGSGSLDLGGQPGKIVFDVSGTIEAVEAAEVEAKALAKAPNVLWLDAPGTATRFKPKDGSFVVDFPGPPKETVSKGKSGDSTIQWTVGTDNDTIAYVVAITDFGAADPSQIDAAAVLDAVAKSQKDPKGLKKYKQDGHPGIVFTREEKGMDHHHRVIVANGRMYQQIVISQKDKTKKAGVEEFFKSFEILVKANAKDD